MPQDGQIANPRNLSAWVLETLPEVGELLYRQPPTTMKWDLLLAEAGITRPMPPPSFLDKRPESLQHTYDKRLSTTIHKLVTTPSLGHLNWQDLLTLAKDYTSQTCVSSVLHAETQEIFGQIAADYLKDIDIIKITYLSQLLALLLQFEECCKRLYQNMPEESASQFNRDLALLQARIKHDYPPITLEAPSTIDDLGSQDLIGYFLAALQNTADPEEAIIERTYQALTCCHIVMAAARKYNLPTAYIINFILCGAQLHNPTPKPGASLLNYHLLDEYAPAQRARTRSFSGAPARSNPARRRSVHSDPGRRATPSPPRTPRYEETEGEKPRADRASLAFARAARDPKDTVTSVKHRRTETRGDFELQSWGPSVVVAKLPSPKAVTRRESFEVEEPEARD